MKRSSRALWFWVLVLVSVILPTTGEGRSKQLYHTNIFKDGFGVGASIIIVSPSGFSFQARTYALPSQAVQRVSLVSDDASWEVVLCENGGLAGDCVYDGSGNINIEGPIAPVMMILAGVTGGAFHDALAGGHMWIRLDGGADGTGNYIRII